MMVASSPLPSRRGVVRGRPLNDHAPMEKWPIFTALLIVMTGTVHAEDSTEPADSRWAGGVLAYGIGATRLEFPHYPGSDQRHTVVLPFPYVTYYSERVEVDGGNLQGRFWQGERFSLDVSSAGALRVDADDNEAREGMDDLGWLAEVGTALRYSPRWTPSDPREWQYRLNLPLRQAIELDGISSSRRGYTLAPDIEVQRHFGHEDQRWEFQGRLSARFASQDYHEHFYGVGANDATTSRPAYQAEAGLTAYVASVGLAWRQDNWWMGGFVRHEDFSDSVVRESPLLLDRRQQSIGLSVAYILGKRQL